MSITFRDMQTLASDYLDDVANGYFTLPVLKQRLNLSMRELQKRLVLAGEQYYVIASKTNTVIGQNAYALPSDFLQIVRLDYVQSGSGPTAVEQKIYAMTPNQRDLVPGISGPPRYYYFQNTNVMLTPVPDLIYEMRLEYTYSLVDMVNDIDLPDCPQQFAEYAILLTVRDCMVKDMRPLGNVETKLKEYEELFKQLAAQRRDDGARMIVSTDALDW